MQRGRVLRTHPLARRHRRRRTPPGLRLLRNDERTPIAVGGVEVATGLGAPALGVDRGVEVGTAGAGQAAVGLLPDDAVRLGLLAGEPGGRVDEGGDVGAQPRVEPGLGEIRRVGGEPLTKGEAGGGAPLAQRIELRPRALGVDVVRA